MSSELFVQVPADYGDWAYAGPGSPLLALASYGREAGVLLNLHLQMILYSKRWRLNGFVPAAVQLFLCRPASPRTAKRDAQRLVDAGFIECRDGGYYVPAAVEWGTVRIGTRDPIPEYIRARVYDRDGHRCVECGTEDNLTLDHIIPWSQNGSDKAANLQTLCGSCNSKKGARV